MCPFVIIWNIHQCNLKPMIHGSTFVEQQMFLLLFNKCWSVSCVVECWNMPFNMLNGCWTLLNGIELGSIPFNKLPHPHSTFVAQQINVEPCIIGLIGLNKELIITPSRLFSNSVFEIWFSCASMVFFASVCLLFPDKCSPWPFFALWPLSGFLFLFYICLWANILPIYLC